jgi:hypothetical protein
MSDSEIFKIFFNEYDEKETVEEYIQKLKKILNEVYYHLKNR